MSAEYGNGTLKWVSCVSYALGLKSDQVRSSKGPFVDDHSRFKP